MIVSPEFVDVAYAFFHGLNIGLGCIVLATLYRSLSDVQISLYSANLDPFSAHCGFSLVGYDYSSLIYSVTQYLLSNGVIFISKSLTEIQDFGHVLAC